MAWTIHSWDHLFDQINTPILFLDTNVLGKSVGQYTGDRLLCSYCCRPVFSTRHHSPSTRRYTLVLDTRGYKEITLTNSKVVLEKEKKGACNVVVFALLPSEKQGICKQ